MTEPPERRDLSGPRECDHRFRWTGGGWQCRYCGVFDDQVPEIDDWFTPDNATYLLKEKDKDVCD